MNDFLGPQRRAPGRTMPGGTGTVASKPPVSHQQIGPKVSDTAVVVITLKELAHYRCSGAWSESPSQQSTVTPLSGQTTNPPGYNLHSMWGKGIKQTPPKQMKLTQAPPSKPPASYQAMRPTHKPSFFHSSMTIARRSTSQFRHLRMLTHCFPTAKTVGSSSIGVARTGLLWFIIFSSFLIARHFPLRSILIKQR